MASSPVQGERGVPPPIRSRSQLFAETEEPLLSLRTLEGVSEPAVSQDAKLTVLVFTRTDCPIANRMAPTLEQLKARFLPRNVQFRLVYPIAQESDQDVRAHAREYGLSFRLYRDVDQRTSLLLGIRVTPEAVVLDSQGNLVYQGRINDRFVDFGVARQHPSREDLALAVEEFLDGRPVSMPRTKAIGCYLVPHDSK